MTAMRTTVGRLTLGTKVIKRLIILRMFPVSSDQNDNDNCDSFACKFGHPENSDWDITCAE